MRIQLRLIRLVLYMFRMHYSGAAIPETMKEDVRVLDEYFLRESQIRK